MKDKYFRFSEIVQSRPKSYEIFSKSFRNNFLIFTPHGGGIEPGTTEICNWFAQNGISSYAFSAKGKQCKDLHVTSTRFDEPRLLRMLARHKNCISFHGMTDYAKTKYDADIFIGGLDKLLTNKLAHALVKARFSVAIAGKFPKSPLTAYNLNNITNKCSSKKGVQIELSENIRKKFFKGNLKFKSGRERTTVEFEIFCRTIREIINHSENGL